MKNLSRILLLAFFAIFSFNTFLTPLLGDDYVHFQLSQGSLSLIENLMHNLQKMYWSWCGRMLAHFLDGLVLAYQSRLLFTVLNVSILLIICVLLFRIIAPKKQSTKYLTWIMIPFLLAFGVKSHFQILYMTTGAANYFWSFAVIAGYLYCFPFLFDQNSKESLNAPSTPRVVMLGLLSFITGCTNENVGLCLLAIFGFCQLQLYWNERKIFPKWLWATQALLLAGTIFLIAAPGNYIRLAVLYPEGLPSIPVRIHWWIESMAIFLGRPDPLIFLAGLAGAVFYLDKSLFGKIRPLFYRYRNFFLLAFLMIFVFMGNDGNFYGRKAVHSFLIFGLGLIVVFVQLIDVSEINTKKLLNVASAISFLVLSRFFFDSYHVVQVHTLYTQRELQIQQDHAKQQNPIITCSIDSIFSLEDLDQKSGEGVNFVYAKYMGVNPIVSTQQPCAKFFGSL